MKKLSKFVLILGSILFFCGLLLTITALALGSDTVHLQQRLDNMGVHWSLRLPGWEDGRGWNYHHYDGDMPLADIPDRPDAPDTPLEPRPGLYEIKNLDFDLGLGDVNIVTGEDFEIIYGNDNARRIYSESMRDDTWVIRSRNVRWERLWPWNAHDDIKLTVVLPRDFVAETMIIGLGAGNMRAGYLRGKKVLLDVGVGNCQIGSLIAEDAHLNVGVGYLEARSFSAGQAGLEVGLGSIELTLAQPLEQHRCKVDVGLGSVQLGGSSYNGVADVNVGDSDAPYSIEIDCGLGSVSIIEAGR